MGSAATNAETDCEVARAGASVMTNLMVEMAALNEIHAVAASPSYTLGKPACLT